MGNQGTLMRNWLFVPEQDTYGAEQRIWYYWSAIPVTCRRRDDPNVGVKVQRFFIAEPKSKNQNLQEGTDQNTGDHGGSRKDKTTRRISKLKGKDRT